MIRVKNEMELLVNKALADAVTAGVFGDTSVDLFPQIKIEYPKDEKFGDYSTPIALESARILKKSPFMIAEQLKEYIEKSPLIENVEVVKPGFINIFLAADYMANFISHAVEQGDLYGTSKKTDPHKYNIEFVSANPTGPLNVVSARAAALGDSLANIIEASGDDVDREYYVNDHGNQVNLFGLSVYCRYQELNGVSIDFPEDGYQGEYIKDIAKVILDNGNYQDSSYDREEDKVLFFGEFAIQYILRSQQDVMNQFGVQYKQWFRESSLHKNGIVMETFEEMKKRGVIFEEDNKMVFRATDFGDDKDRVVVRDDGRPTYLMADIAYHENKFNRGYDSIIDIWGPDHHGYIARLKGAVESLGHDSDKFTVLIAQQVNLVMDGEAVKMSKRLGRFSTMQELVDDIGVDAARYFFVARSMDSHLDFDIELAKKRSSENPVFYLQYAHARICSIFKKAEENKIDYNYKRLVIEHMDSAETLSLIRTIIRFPEEVVDAATSQEVHRIATYLLRLAQNFHRFYTVNRILGDDKAVSESMLTICYAARIVLRNGLKMLGVSAPESM